MKAVTNFGSIGGRRCVTFKVSNDGKVIPAKLRGDNCIATAEYARKAN